MKTVQSNLLTDEFNTYLNDQLEKAYDPYAKVKKQNSTKVLTKEQFRNQFPQKCNVSGVLDILQLDNVTYGYEIYRALNLLILKDGNEYFCTGR